MSARTFRTRKRSRCRAAERGISAQVAADSNCRKKRALLVHLQSGHGSRWSRLRAAGTRSPPLSGCCGTTDRAQKRAISTIDLDGGREINAKFHRAKHLHVRCRLARSLRGSRNSCRKCTFQCLFNDPEPRFCQAQRLQPVFGINAAIIFLAVRAGGCPASVRAHCSSAQGFALSKPCLDHIDAVKRVKVPCRQSGWFSRKPNRRCLRSRLVRDATISCAH